MGFSKTTAYVLIRAALTAQLRRRATKPWSACAPCSTTPMAPVQQQRALRDRPRGGRWRAAAGQGAQGHPWCANTATTGTASTTIGMTTQACAEYALAGLEQLSKLLRSRQAGAAGARNRHVPTYIPVPPRRAHPPGDCSLRFVSRSYSAPARRRILAVDSGLRRNRFAATSHGFLNRDGESPA
ncbi:hypothetical protein XCCB100_4374 [Xanthomonas campestris pv. campestris]|uniref:Uncharacterized protein n=1 Tax=Xanthomonas campestris pv. campestris (strain B100) TaxID=509169 RepID=B0RMD1_XANCB|nr:hypothetical protein XCCB100_4374 [Xanthomonas campestris pv. campestris]